MLKSGFFGYQSEHSSKPLDFFIENHYHLHPIVLSRTVTGAPDHPPEERQRAPS
jgi:hypothetical protein